jgi:hypothetical protein
MWNATINHFTYTPTSPTYILFTTNNVDMIWPHSHNRPVISAQSAK